jgi:hypothetical protein
LVLISYVILVLFAGDRYYGSIRISPCHNYSRYKAEWLLRETSLYPTQLTLHIPCGNTYYFTFMKCVLHSTASVFNVLQSYVQQFIKNLIKASHFKSFHKMFRLKWLSSGVIICGWGNFFLRRCSFVDIWFSSSAHVCIPPCYVMFPVVLCSLSSFQHFKHLKN